MREVAALFLKLGLIAFGGPAAHVALMRREVVDRRRWFSAEDFSRMFAACNLVPGPSSTELAIFIGYRRAGWRALLLAGSLFILPAMLLMLALAWAYSRYGSAPVAVAVLRGVRPVIVGIVAWAAIDLARRLLARRWLLALSAAAGLAVLLDASPVLVILAGGLVRAGVQEAGAARAAPALLALAPAMAAGRLPTLFLTFLKIGAVSFGSGYVLLPFLRDDFVQGLHWLSDRQLLDAVALGQATPGPVFTTATFLGYLFAGVPGALVATAGIFLPGFVLVPFLDRLLELVQRRPAVESFVDGANAAAIGLIAGSVVLLGRSAVVDPVTGVLALGTVALLLKWPLASPVAVAVGAAAGWLRWVL